MFLRTENLPEKKMVGISLSMSLADNKTALLWQTFMPKRNEISHAIGSELYSLQVYENTQYFSAFNPSNVFEKWALREVSAFENIPQGMQTFVLKGGLYAVFLHKGTVADAPKTFGYILGEWLPNSAYELAHLPHFELLGEKYRNNDPDSEEEIWIPIQLK